MVVEFELAARTHRQSVLESLAAADPRLAAQISAQELVRLAWGEEAFALLSIAVLLGPNRVRI